MHGAAGRDNHGTDIPYFLTASSIIISVQSPTLAKFQHPVTLFIVDLRRHGTIAHRGSPEALRRTRVQCFL